MMETFADAPWWFQLVAIVIVGGWIWMAATAIRSGIGKRRLANSPRVTVADLRSMDGEAVEVRGHVVPGPDGLVTSFTGDVACVYVRRTVAVWMEFEDPEAPGTAWSSDVESDDVRPTSHPWFGIRDETGTVWTRPQDYDHVPGEALVDERQELRPTWTEESRHRRTTERVVREGTPVTVRGTVEFGDDGQPWLRPTLGERLQRLGEVSTPPDSGRIPPPTGFRETVRRIRGVRTDRSE